MKVKGKEKDLFQDLTWSDLEQWAGNKTLSRGRSYQRDHRVQDLRQSAEGRLIAWVQGGRRYATRGSFEEGDWLAVASLDAEDFIEKRRLPTFAKPNASSRS